MGAPAGSISGRRELDPIPPPPFPPWGGGEDSSTKSSPRRGHPPRGHPPLPQEWPMPISYTLGSLTLAGGSAGIRRRVVRRGEGAPHITAKMVERLIDGPPNSRPMELLPFPNFPRKMRLRIRPPPPPPGSPQMPTAGVPEYYSSFPSPIPQPGFHGGFQTPDFRTQTSILHSFFKICLRPTGDYLTGLF